MPLLEKGRIARFVVSVLALHISSVVLIVSLKYLLLPYEPYAYVYRPRNLIFTTASHLVILLISVPIKFSFDYFNLQSKRQKEENQRLLAEMKYLKQQIHPHFLFNTLNNLYYLCQHKSDLAPSVVEKLSEIMRYMLDQGEQALIRLSEEIEFTKAYVELEKIRVHRIDVAFDIQLDRQDYLIPPMLMLPLIENAFKHGINKSSQNNEIKIHLTAKDGRFQLDVDNKKQNHVETTSKGFGLENLLQRLTHLYQEDFELEREENDGYFHVSLQLPLECKN